nr:hypothetical protein BaRGS_001692 [Batillaria attramentaria]
MVKLDKGSDSESEDVDIDIENDDGDDNLILQSRSASPSSVYSKLLQQANVEKISENVREEEVERGGKYDEQLAVEAESSSPHGEEQRSSQDEEDSDDCLTQNSDTVMSSGSSSKAEVGLTSGVGLEAEDGEEDGIDRREIKHIVNGVIAASGEVFEFPIPIEENTLSADTVLEEEKMVHAEFFDGRPLKTPERYLKIRNYILDCWKKSKPAYLNKTSVRPGLKNCGDVNCIGRIHAYLESVGAINFGCVSQTLASEQIEDVQMKVVGWYHSHPTFAPNPSVRDIETQQKFQYWFAKGGNPFVGIIISPYSPQNASVISDIRCLTIGDDVAREFLCNTPYQFSYEVAYRDSLREILGPASELAEKYSTYSSRVALSQIYKSSLSITCLSKMLQSVKHRLEPPDPERPIPGSRRKVEDVLHWLEQIFLEKFSPTSSRCSTDTDMASVNTEAGARVEPAGEEEEGAPQADLKEELELRAARLQPDMGGGQDLLQGQSEMEESC